MRKVVIESPQAKDWQRVGEAADVLKENGIEVNTFGVRLMRKRFRTPDGKEEDFFSDSKKPGVTALTITPDGSIVLVGQFKQGREVYCYEAPAGIAKKGEDFAQRGLTEVEQESGYRGEEIKRLCESASCPGPRKSDKEEHLYLVTGARFVGSQKLDATEFIEVIEVSPDEFVRMREQGEIISSGTREAFGLALEKGYIML